jgi:fibronectin type 3 domain-containing protein
MKKILRLLLAGMLLAGALRAALTTEQFAWKNVDVGGKGTAMGFIPAGPNHWYLRTDVSYPYRWDHSAQRWEPMLGQYQTIFEQKPGSTFYDTDLTFGVDCLGADSLNPNVVYAVIGLNDSGAKVAGNLFKSTDGGVTFARSTQRIWAHANAQQDFANRILLDRASYVSAAQDYRVVYIASREGLFRSLDAGATWTKNASWPTGSLANLFKLKSYSGLAWIVADESGGTVGTAGSSTNPLRSRVLFLGGSDAGTYRSLDGGDSWIQLSSSWGWRAKLVPAGSPTKVGGSPGPATTASVLYITSASGLLRVQSPEIGTPAFTVLKTTIPNGGTWSRGYCGFDVDPTNANHLILGTDIGGNYANYPSNPNRIFRSLNAGSSWSELDMSSGSGDPNATSSAAAMGGGFLEVVFDPANPNRVFYCTRVGPWKSDNITVATPSWQAMYKGFELGVVTSGVIPSGNGSVVFHHGSGDYDGQSNVDLDDATTSIFRRNVITNPGVVDSGAKHSPVGWDYRKDNPNTVWFSGLRDYQLSSPVDPKKDYRVGYTTNGGISWTFVDPLKLPGAPSQILASVNSNRVVLSTANGVGTPGLYWSDDFGVNWTRSNGFSGSLKGTYIFNNYQKTVASDHVSAGTFYAVLGNTLYRSTDAAVNFSTCANAGLSSPVGDSNAGGWLDAASGRSGYLLWAAQAGGLFVSTNAATPTAANVAFTKLADVSLAYRATWGAPAPGATEPTLYVLGIVLGEKGVFLSKDLGANWVKISDPSRLFGQNPRVIAADPDLYGRLILGTVGTGLWYSDASGSASLPPSPPTSVAAVAGNAQVALTWGSVGNATSYTVKYGTAPGTYPTSITGLTATNRTVTGLANGTTYHFIVTATNANGTSGNSASVSARPGTPSVALTSPGASSSYTAPASIVVSANASDVDGTVSKVEFFANGGLINTDTAAPYTYNYTGVAAGSYTFTAVVTDNSSLTATSAPVTVAVSPGIPQAATAPVIDGTVDTVWSTANTVAVANISGTVSSTADLSANWRALWDASYLYLLVETTDDIRTVDSGTALFNDDAVELFLDADNSNGPSYGGNDFQFLFSADGTTFQESKHNATAGVSFARVNGPGGSYTMEIRIPWTTLTVAPAANNLLGIDVQVDDDDDGGARDGLRQWSDTGNQVWSNPSLMGTVRLTASGTPTPPPAVPAGLAAVAGNARVDLAWSAASGATSYRVKRGTSAGGPFTQIGSDTAALVFTDTAVTNETTYHYVVAAVNSAGASADSSPAVAAMPTAYTAVQVAAVTPVIDGAPDQAWLSSQAFALANPGGTVSSAADLSGTWRAQWDATHLYVLFEIADDTKKNDSADPWFDDSVEVYLDIGNTKTTTYGANHFHYAFGWNDTAVTEANGKSTAGVVYAWTNSPTGYHVEIRIPWSTLGATPASGQLVGFDVQLNDDDDAAAARDGLLQWFDTTNTAYANPSKFGTIRLSGTPSAVPAAPAGLIAVAGNAAVSLAWNASSGATSYKLKRATTVAGTYTTLASALTTTAYTDTTAANGTTYYYVVSAVNSGGESANSAPPVSARPEVPPAAPTGVAATLSGGQVNLTWNPVVTASSYAVMRGTTSGGPYEVLDDDIATTTYSDPTITTGTTYYYVVRAANLGGQSGNSAQVTVSTLAPPAAPTGVAATPGNTLVRVSWNTVAGATAYTVRWGTASGSHPNSTSVSSGPFNVTGLVNGTTYYFVVAAVNAAGEGANSAQASAAPVAPPAAPTNLVATPGNAQVALTWSASSGATGYNVKRAPAAGGAYTVLSSPTGTNYTDTTAVNGTTYAYFVSALKNLSESPDAGPAVATPLASALPVADAYVNAGSSSGTNFGTNALLFVKNSGVGDTTREAFLRFNVGGLQNAPSVKLRLTPTTIQGAPTLNIESVATDTWIESGGGSITWSNKPASSGTILASSNVFTVNTAAEFDLTGAVRAEAAANGLLSLRLALPAVNATDQYQFASKENGTAAYRPQLVVTFTDWTQGDVGTVGLAGSAAIADATGVFTLAAAGAGINGTADAGYFVDQPLVGNGEIVARVVSVQNPNSNARAGIAIRDTVAANAIHASALISAGGTIEFRRRTATGGSTSITSVTGFAPAFWLKLVRSGNSLSAYRSPDGTTWTQVGTTQTVTMAATARIGLVATSGTTAALGTSVFDNVTVRPAP